MMLLAEIRRSGATASLTPTGGIQLRHVPAILAQRVKEQKPEVLKALQSEVGKPVTPYSSSSLYLLIEDFYLILKGLIQDGVNPKECAQLIDILDLIDNEARANGLLSAKQLVDSHSGHAWRLLNAIIPNVPIEGGQLQSVVKDLFARPKPEPKQFDLSVFAPTAQGALL